MNNIKFPPFLKQKPNATAVVLGNPDHADLYGVVRFYQTNLGTIVESQVSGLPTNNDVCRQPVFGFHIHNGESCSGNSEDFFADTLGHYNPNSCPHPFHAGDMPPLFGVKGFAFSIFLTDRFNVKEIIGKTVVIHSGADDFTTQPAGNSGKKIACGIIESY